MEQTQQCIGKFSLIIVLAIVLHFWKLNLLKIIYVPFIFRQSTFLLHNHLQSVHKWMKWFNLIKYHFGLIIPNIMEISQCQLRITLNSLLKMSTLWIDNLTYQRNKCLPNCNTFSSAQQSIPGIVVH